MREILFKAKRVDDCKWVQGQYVNYWHPNIRNATGHFIVEYPGTLHEIYTNTLCQYTGLTDKNGVKIFESDLMRFDNGEEEFSDYAVDWSNASWKVACDDGSFPDNLDEFFSKRAEVIGNIHDKENDHEG